MFVRGHTLVSNLCARLRFSLPPRPRIPPVSAPPSSVTGNPVTQGRGLRQGEQKAHIDEGRVHIIEP